MTSNWKKCKIGDLCTTISDTYKGDDEKVVLINTSDVLEGKILNHELIDNKNLKGQFKKTFQKNDILYSEIRPANKRFAFVDIEYTANYIASTKLMVIRPYTDLVLPQYLYMILKSQPIIDELQHLAETRSGTFPQITFSAELAPIDIKIPPLETQQKIAKVLSAIDDKIELNNSINNNLEQQAQAIFKSWFVDFEPFGGTMPKIWKNGTIEDLSQNIICGKTPSTSKKEYYGNDIPFITIPDMHNNTYVTKTERYLSRLGASSQKNKILPPNSICVSCIATAGLVSITAFYSQTNQQINSIIPAQEMSSYYIYLLLKSLSKKIIMLGSSGSTTCNLNKGQFAKIEVIIPDKNVLKKHDEIVSPLFESIKNNQLENEQLAQLRDTLLPKLMNGEIDVSKVDIDDILTNQSADKLLFSEGGHE